MDQIKSKADIYFHRLCDKIRERRARQLLELSKHYLAKGSPEEAMACLKRSLLINNNFSGAYGLMAKILMPGDNYLSVLARFHEYIKPETYVEIGVHKGNSLALAQDQTVTIGIDPFPCIEKKIRSNARIYPITSDEFFGRYNLFEELKKEKLSLAFIDGLHHSEQVLKDFINLERYSDKDTVIILHDCLPISKTVASRTRSTTFWTGDTWKAIMFLIKYRPDLNIRTIPTPPSGLIIVTNFDSSSTILSDKYDQFISDYQNQELPYDYLDSTEGKLFINSYTVVPNQESSVRLLIPTKPK